MSAGQVMFGNSVSLTITLKPQLRPLPLPSVTLHTTKLVPFGKVEPLAGVQLAVTGPQLSIAVGAYVTLARLHWPGSVFRVMSAGHVTFGTSLSLMITLKPQVWPLPL